MKKIIIFFFLPLQLLAQVPGKEELNRWEKRANAVTIIRDQWGIPHIYGKSDADCVFGLMYAQSEDDFDRIEMNYLEKLGRMAEIKGESLIYEDLLNRLVLDSAEAINDYNSSPAWLKELLIAFADGMNYYLYRNPGTKPSILHHFEPWYPLLWTDGSISAIRTAGITIGELKDFYSGESEATTINEIAEPPAAGSNGFAIAPSRSASGHALLYINPHVSFYFRSEVQMVSEQGLNSYGAVTWGQFFVYQGFNEHCGWMHTTSAADAEDLYIEKISKHGDSLFYEYEQKQRPVVTKNIRIGYQSAGGIKSKTFRALFTQHGPVIAKRTGNWLSLKANNRTRDGLIQSWLRIKTKNIEEFRKVLQLRGNSSNNTVYADDRGNIAYWHGNYLPIRDRNFDWSKPVEGTIAGTEWKGVHGIDEIVHVYNPLNGWIQNCNSTPFTVSGPNSPNRSDFPAYMAPDGENFRGVNAVRVLARGNAYTLETLIKTGYDNYLAAFERLVPVLVMGFEKMEAQGDHSYDSLAAPIALLKQWDFRCSTNSVASSLAIEWGQKILPQISKYYEQSQNDQVLATDMFITQVAPAELLKPLREVIFQLTQSFGHWQVPLGEINRYQRLNGHVDPEYDDHSPSLPVGRVSSTWGCIPSFVSRYFPGTKLRYGYNGNSFICAVEFGEKVKAKSLLTGGESGDPDSKHFSDQAAMYVDGQFKDVLFYKEDVMAHAERTYHPGK